MHKLLTCISFHYKQEKYKYLKLVLNNILRYKINVSIIIDTNKEETLNLICKDFLSEIIEKKINVIVHKDLQPVKRPIIRTKEGLENLSKSEWSLTWKHRKHILENINDFDVFMYTEDDMLVSFENYENYLNNFYNLWPNYIPSFVRVEVKNNVLYNTDAFFITKILKNNIIKISSKKFVNLKNPYHAFWIMPKKELKESINENFTTVIHNTWLRESAASFGLKCGACPEACWPSNDIQKIGLVEIDENYKISKNCYAYHLPNNYIDDYRVKFGKIKLNNIIKVEHFKKFI